MHATTDTTRSGMDSIEAARKERRAKYVWVSLIVGLLGLQVVIGFSSIYLANSDPTVAVIPDYYEKAVNWDTTRRALSLSDQLGWQIDAAIAPAFEDRRQIVVRLTSSDDEPIEGVQVTGKAYRHARGEDVDSLRFTDAGAGRYQTTTYLQQNGLWNIFLRIEGPHGVAAKSLDLVVE